MKSALEARHCQVLQLSGSEREMVDGQPEFLADGGVRHQAVVGAERDREPALEHRSERMGGDAVQGGRRLQIARQANFDGDASFSEVVDQGFKISSAVGYPLVLQACFVEEEETVPDALGVQSGDCLQDALGAVGLPGVNGLAQQGAPGQGVSLDEMTGGEAVLGPGDVEPDDLDSRTGR